MVRRAMLLATVGAAVAVGIFSLHLARIEPDLSYAGASTAGAVALLGAGWALVGSGLAFWARRRAGHIGLLLVAAGFAWLVLEWNNPRIGSALAFTVGLCLYTACPPLVGHAVLAYPRGRLGSHLERGAVAALYVGCVLVLGVLPALLFDPRLEGCFQCPRNLVLIADSHAWLDQLNHAGVYVAVASTLALAMLALVRLLRGRGAAPTLVAGAAYLGLVAAAFAASLDRGFLFNGTLERRLWLGQAAALLTLTLGIAWRLGRTRRARTAVARLVVELAQSPPPGGLRQVLAGIAGDPDLLLGYPLDGSDRLVDAQGHPVEPAAREQRTTLVRDGRPVAVLAHRRGLLDDDHLVEELTAAARLALENERLQAEVRARVEELRASRARIVAAGDAERKRLERDLHDGAQQRLVGLSLSLRLLRTQLGPEASSPVLEEAELELRRAIADLRELAHGIFPAVLADEGLAAAVETLAEENRVPLRIRRLPEERYAPEVETAAYTVIAETVRAASGPVAVDAVCSDGTLVVGVEATGVDADPVGLEDRIGALDGRLTVEQGDGARLTIRAELPCGS
jgi:signal transduction histidine kinase